MAGIVALRGIPDGGCGCSGMGADAPAPAIATDPKMSPLTVGMWVAALGTVGYIFWATLQPPKRSQRRSRA